MTRMQGLLSRLKNIVPWLIAVAIFYYLFRKYPIAKLVEAADYLNLAYFMVYAVAYFIVMWFIDCWSLMRLFSRFVVPTQFRELAEIRVASYLLMIVNYGMGQGALAYFFKQQKKVPLFKSSSLLIFSMIMDLYWTITLAFLGSLFFDPVVGDFPLSGIILTLWGAASVGLVALFAFWRLPLQWQKLHWIRTRDLFHTFHNARLSDYVYALLLRLPLHLVLNTAMYIVALTYGAHIPLAKVIGYSPVVVLIATIPITPGGFGTMQLATVELFKSSISGGAIAAGLVTPGELLLSMSVLFVFMNYFLKALVGSLFLGKVLRVK